MNTSPEISRSRKSRIFTSRITIIALAAFALFMLTAASAFMAPPLQGAIYTTDVACGGVNINLYPNKDAVYLNGGPQNQNGPGLDDGSYYVKVTEPDGTLLGSSIGGPFGNQPVHVTNGSFDQCYQLSSIVSPPGGAPAPGYNDTTNNGNEYKVWVCQDSNFTNSGCKTDNFKFTSDATQTETTLQALNFYDTNKNGVTDAVEGYLEEWKFELNSASVTNTFLSSFVCTT